MWIDKTAAAVAPGQPAYIFATVNAGSRAGTFTGYASWNGATDVAYWRVWGGPTWQYRAQVPRHGFETAIPFTASGATNFRAYAHDVHGNLLGTSRDVPAT